MLKYVNTGVVFQEIPDETTLTINISNCPNHCPGCHSKYLWADIGNPLNEESLGRMINEFGTAGHMATRATSVVQGGMVQW